MNRRQFIRHFGVYLAATSATCATCLTAFAQWPGSDNSQPNDNGWPSTDNSSNLGESASGYQLEGCSLKGNLDGLNNRMRFLQSSGNRNIDQGVFGEANILLQVTGLQPSLAFLDDSNGKNAFAMQEDAISRRSRHGAVAIGVRLIGDLLAMPSMNPANNTLSIQAVLVHEWAHIGQYAAGLGGHQGKGPELMADFVAGWYIGAKSRSAGTNVDISSAMVSMFSLGDTNFNSASHHGTPNERLAAYVNGAKYGTGAGYGGGLGGGYGNGMYGIQRFGGGQGAGNGIPTFQAAFQLAAQTYMRG